MKLTLINVGNLNNVKAFMEQQASQLKKGIALYYVYASLHNSMAAVHSS